MLASLIPLSPPESPELVLELSLEFLSDMSSEELSKKKNTTEVEISIQTRFNSESRAARPCIDDLDIVAARK